MAFKLHRLILNLKQPGNTLWVTPTLGAVAAVFFAFAARIFNVWLPSDILPKIELDTLKGLLDVIASSMLAVSTFSLSIMVSAFSSAASSATPRATELVMGDDNTRMAIASFISAFIYAIIARTALGMGYYGQNGRFILFVSTALVMAYLIVTLIRWVHTLSQLGRMGNTLGKIDTAAKEALLSYRQIPNLGATWQGSPSDNAIRLYAKESGYLMHVDMASLQKYAEDNDWYLHLPMRAGEMVLRGSVLAVIDNANPSQEDDIHKLLDSFVFSSERSYNQDSRWGFVVLSEAAQRALSPAVNDPGTAISVITRMLRLLVDTRCEPNPDAPEYDRLSIAPLDCGEWVRDGFAPIARDGAGIVEIGLVLQKALAGIWRYAPEPDLAQAAYDEAKLALQRAEQVLEFEPDKERLRQKHQALFGHSS